MKKIIFLLMVLVCFTLVSCNKTDTPDDSNNNNTSTNKPNGAPEKYNPTDTLVSFSDENEDKVITEATFDITQFTNDGSEDIMVNSLFSEGMCLQRDAINRIYGKAGMTKNIAIEINGGVYYGTIDGFNWEVYLPKMNAGGPYDMTIISEAGRVTIKDIYIGEVFLLSGQSNMEWTMANCEDVLEEYYATNDCVNNEIRLLNMGFTMSATPTDQALNIVSWQGAESSSIESFSAVGYLFGKQMHEELDCPVGLILSAIGGSSMEFWLNEENYNKVCEVYTPVDDGQYYMDPCHGYNGLLYPLRGLNVRGVLWYQGESNAWGTQDYYDYALEVFIDQCREMFNNEQLTFTICELARFEGWPYPMDYSIINEKINLVATKDPYVVVARNLDQGEWNNIHPKDKREIARRAAYETLRVFFKLNKPAPVTVTDYSFNEDGSVTITLSCDAKLVNGTNSFEVYIDGVYTYDCNVTIDKNVLTVTATGEITKVRYGYDCPHTDAVKEDVSKFVTVYDNNGFPLDLFEIF